jgi:Transposase DDE domain group 1
MRDSKIELEFRATGDWQESTAHGLLVEAYRHAEGLKLFEKLESSLNLRMKKVRYHWTDKLKTLWASVVVGCQHTSEINDRLGAHEQACAAMFGMERFPDQSQVNRLLCAFGEQHLEEWRRVHMQLLCERSLARSRSRWLCLNGRKRMLAIDLDQRAIVAHGKEYELAKVGYMGRRRRGYRGYQLSVAFIGGGIGEVLDEYFDSGDVSLSQRLDELLKSIGEFCQRTGIAADEVLIRADSTLGSPSSIRKIKAAGFHYLLKGKAANRARRLNEKAVTAEKIFWRVKGGEDGHRRWMCDLGEIEHIDQGKEHQGEVESARTLLMAREELAVEPAGARGGRRKKKPERVVKIDYFLTDLTAEELPLEQLLYLYDDRATIERYFYDEQYSLGAKHLRTHHFAGAAVFQYLVATTNNLLRWLQHSSFKGTELEKMGLGRLVNKAMQIPARIKRWGRRWIVELPQQHYIVKQLSKSWSQLQGPLTT